MHCSRLVIFMLVVVAATGCIERPSRVPSGAYPITINPILEGNSLRYSSGMTVRDRLVIRDQASWERTWLEIVGSLRPIPPAPVIDFANDVAIVAAMGTKNTGGYAIDIEDVHLMDGDVWVSVHETSPGQRCIVTAAFSHPVDVAVVPRFEGKATFVERASDHDCGP